MAKGIPTTSVHKTTIRATLERIGAIRPKNTEIFSSNTRDRKGLAVFRDAISKVIFIDGHYVGDEEYQSGIYRQDLKPALNKVGQSYEDLADSERRFEKYKQFIAAGAICDFGCGAGTFLRLSSNVASSICGIELQEDYAAALNRDGINVLLSIEHLTS